jgi:hypothetical protein
MSAQHPPSELVASGILDAVGIPCQHWRLVVLPGDPALGVLVPSVTALTEDGRLRAGHAPAERELVDPEAADA